jgi:hypothetical protein
MRILCFMRIGEYPFPSGIEARAMITFILLPAFFIIAVMFALLAYSANKRKRAGQSGTVATGALQRGRRRTNPARSH